MYVCVCVCVCAWMFVCQLLCTYVCSHACLNVCVVVVLRMFTCEKAFFLEYSDPPSQNSFRFFAWLQICYGAAFKHLVWLVMCVQCLGDKYTGVGLQ